LIITLNHRTTLFPYTTLFRSHAAGAGIDRLPARQLPDRRVQGGARDAHPGGHRSALADGIRGALRPAQATAGPAGEVAAALQQLDRKSTRLNSSHLGISYAVF